MMILLTGGSACGKSSFAEKLCLTLPLPRYYLAAMRPFGTGSSEKIQKHREMRRGKGFETVERYTDYVNLVLPLRGTALLECICNLTANEMFDENGVCADPVSRVLSGVEALLTQCEHLIVVTNEIGGSAESYSPETNRYLAAVGSINRSLAERADCVCELVCGIPVVLKGQLPKEVLEL